jgi:hypothetical protein
MTFALTCRHCDEVILGADEDDLVAHVQAHAASHAEPQALTKEHILRRYRRLQDRQPHENA